uniref:PhnA-like protein n=1 Tax=Cyanothece sp. (strain PCC 7425 / ATCC 29141) TaxID=395961 RepID=B8HPW2_CYAP4
MAYVNRPADSVVERTAYTPAIDYHDRVRWGPVLAGLVIALSSQLILSALGAALGFTTIATSGAPRTQAGDVGTAVGIWSIISLFISLFIGGWITARTCGPMSRGTALLNGAILWGTTLVLSSWLLASGVSGAFGIIASNAGDIVNQAQQGTIPSPNVPTAPTAQQTRDIADNLARFGWSFGLGALLGLLASMLGASLGTRSIRSNGAYTNR